MRGRQTEAKSMHYLGSTVQSADIVAAILSWCLAINSCMGVFLRIVVGLGTTCNDTQTGNARNASGQQTLVGLRDYNEGLCIG